MTRRTFDPETKMAIVLEVLNVNCSHIYVADPGHYPALKTRKICDIVGGSDAAVISRPDGISQAQLFDW